MSNAAARTLQPSLAERVRLLLQRVDYRRADTDEDREAIFRLRYDAYLREGAIEPSFARRVTDKYDDLDNAWIIGLHMDGRLVSSFRFHVATSDYPDMPSMQVFGDVLTPILESGRTVVDPTRFVIDTQLASEAPELHLLTVRIGHMAAEFFHADLVLATVRAEHQAFYRRVFGHTLVCEPRLYPGLTKPISLMMLEPDQVRERINSRYPFFVSSLAEQADLFGYPEAFRQQIGRVRPLAANDQTALAG